AFIFRDSPPAHKPPAPTQLTHRQHQLVAALLQWQIDSVVFRINDAEEPGVAEVLGAAAAEENLAVQEDADVVAVADLEFFHLVAVALDGGARVHHLHPRLRLQALGKVVGKGHPRMRGLEVTIKNNKPGRLRLYIFPGDSGALGARERAL